MVTNPELAKELLIVGFERYNGEFTDGTKANNKLQLDFARLKQYPETLGKVVMGICDIAEELEPDFVVGVPDGATGLANKVSGELSRRLDKDIFQVALWNNKKTKRMGYLTDIDAELARISKTGILIEDVLTKGTNSKLALSVDGLAEKIEHEIVVFKRGFESDCKEIGLDIHPLAGMPIQPRLPDDSELWQFAK